MKRLKVLSQHGPSATSVRGMSELEARGYHHVFDEPDSDYVVLTWPRTLPLREGDRGWRDLETIQRRLPELAEIPTVLLWAPEDEVFQIETANRLKELLSHAEGPILFDRAPLPAGRSWSGPGPRRRRIPESHGGEQAVKVITPADEELSYLRADPLLWEKELDVRPDVAEAIERATGMRAGPSLLALIPRSPVQP